MAGYLKKVFIIGNLGRDPEARYSQDGKMYTSFSVAVNDRPRRNQPQGDANQSGQPEENTTWFRVTAFGRQAEIVNEYLRKGTSVFVSGDLSLREFIGNNDGQKHYSLEVVMQDMQILTPKGMTEGGSPAFGAQPSGAAAAPGAGRPPARAPEPDFDDEGDIPF